MDISQFYKNYNYYNNSQNYVWKKKNNTKNTLNNIIIKIKKNKKINMPLPKIQKNLINVRIIFKTIICNKKMMITKKIKLNQNRIKKIIVKSIQII